MAKTRGDLSQKTGFQKEVAIEFERIGGYNHIGRWIFKATVPSSCPETPPPLAFAVEFLPRNLRHSRVAAFQPLALPPDLENSLSDFANNLFGKKNPQVKSRTLRTPVEIVRCVFSMLNNENLQVGTEPLAEVKRVVEWIFKNPESAASVEGKKVKWYYTHPILGEFYITEIPA